MKNYLIARGLFWGAAFAALVVYFLSAPDGLPWNESSHWAAVIADAISSARPIAAELPHPIWGRFVEAFAGHHIALAAVWAAFAAGWVAVLAFRFLGWRVAIAASLVWIFAPPVWNRVVTGDRQACLLSAIVLAVWLVVCIAFFVLRKARGIQPGEVRDVVWWEIDPALRPAKIMRIAAWSVLGVGVLFALVSLTKHDYRLGEPASVYARGVVEEAGDRIIILNGIADDQVVREAGKRTVSLLDGSSDYRSCLVAFVKEAFPNATNLWTAARIGAAAFADAAAKAHPERFSAMDGRTTTAEAWEARWEAFKPYLKSGDPFVSVGRRQFGYEGNAVGNGLSGEKAYALYKRIYTEVDPGNISALVNMSEMIRLGYAAFGDEKRALQAALEHFFKDNFKREHLRAIVRVSGPIRTDAALLEKIEAEAKKRLADKVASGEEVGVSPEILTLVDWSNKMITLLDCGERERAGRVARKILSNEKWRGHVPANAVMGVVSAAEGDYTASAAFFAAATNSTEKIPAATLNDFADVLLKLDRPAEAEVLARRALEAGGKGFWVAQLTLADILVRQKKNPQERRDLCRAALVNAPESLRKKVRERVEEIRRETF